MKQRKSISMKKIILFFTLVSPVVTFAQSHTPMTISAQVGVDGAGHGTVYENKYNGTVLDRDTSGAATVMYPVSVHVNVFKWVSVGLVFQAGSYIEDPDNAEANGNKARFLSGEIKFYPVNKDKFAWYLGFRFGGSHLEINRLIDIVGVKVPYQYQFSGSNFGAFTGFNWYFAKNVGMYFNLGYTSNNFLLTDYSINSTAQNISGFDNHMWTKGANASLGLALRFGGK